MQSQRNNLKAGLFVVSGLTLLFACVIIFADLDKWIISYQQCTVRFSLDEGIAGLKSGSPVTVGGQPVGKVTRVYDQISEGVVRAKLVNFQIPDDLTIYETAVIELNAPPLGSGAVLNIVSFGAPLENAKQVTSSGSSWLYEHGTDPPLKGGAATSPIVKSFAKQLGIENEQQLQIQNSIKALEQLMTALGAESTSLAEALRDIKTITSAVAKRTPSIMKNVDQTTGKIDAITGNAQKDYKTWAASIGTFLNKANETLAKLDKAVQTVQTVLDENKPVVAAALKDARLAMEHARAVMKTAREQWVTRITDLINDANDSMKSVKRTAADLENLLTTERPNLERTLANLRILSDQLKLTGIEIRRAPWRLLYEPDEKELETDNLYDAARSFATAAASLNAANASLEALINKKGGDKNLRDKRIEQLKAKLEESIKRFTEAEEKFFKELKKRN